MKTLKRIRYDTMNSWNLSTSLAYNMKIYNVVDNDLQDRVYELMNADGFYNDINALIQDFDQEYDYQWQAGFNGRSGGYLVLYKGGKRIEHKSICTICGQRNFTSTKETGTVCGKCGKNTREDRTLFTIYTQPGLNIELEEVPVSVRNAFRKLAVDIVRAVEYMAKNATIEDEEVISTKKVINY